MTNKDVPVLTLAGTLNQHLQKLPDPSSVDFLTQIKGDSQNAYKPLFFEASKMILESIKAPQNGQLYMRLRPQEFSANRKQVKHGHPIHGSYHKLFDWFTTVQTNNCTDNRVFVQYVASQKDVSDELFTQHISDYPIWTYKYFEPSRGAFTHRRYGNSRVFAESFSDLRERISESYDQILQKKQLLEHPSKGLAQIYKNS